MFGVGTLKTNELRSPKNPLLPSRMHGVVAREIRADIFSKLLPQISYDFKL